MKFVIFRERFFSNTHFIIEKSNGHGEKCPKNSDCQGKMSKNGDFQGKMSQKC